MPPCLSHLPLNLQLSIVGSGLAYSAASSHLIALAGQVTNQFQKGLFQGFMDLHLAASWNQVQQGVKSNSHGPCSVTLSKGGSCMCSKRSKTRDLLHIEG